MIFVTQKGVFFIEGGMARQCNISVSCADSLVFNLQFIHDGYLPRRFSEHDLNAHVAQRLRSIQQGGRGR